MPVPPALPVDRSPPTDMPSSLTHSIPLRRRMLALWGLSGFSTLTFELVWMREMALWAGSTVTAATLVTTVFFAAAAGGNLLGARLLRPGTAPLRLYARFEMLAAITAVLSLLLCRGLWPHLAQWPQGTWLHLCVALLLAGPASLCAGVAFPCLAESFVATPAERAASGSAFYGVNLLGATLGVITGGVLLPWHLGILGTFLVAAAVQFIAGGLAMSVKAPLPASLSAKPRPAQPGGGLFGWFCLVASGLLSLATQALLLLWTRQVLEGSLFAMSGVLAVFIAGLGLGALAVGALRRRGVSLRVLMRRYAAAGAVLLLLLPWFGRRWSLEPPPLTATTPLGQCLEVLGLCLPALPLVFCLGGIFPLAWELLGHSVRGEGRTLGLALAGNKLGAAAGGLLLLHVILPCSSLATATHAVAWGYALIALLVLRPRLSWAITLIAGGLWLTAMPSPPPGVTPDLNLIDSRCGAYGPVSVVEKDGSRQILLNSRQRLSGTGRALASQQHQSWAPLLLCPRPERVLTIGMAAGISADAVLDFPVHHLDAVELVPEVVSAAREHFSTWNSRLFSDPRAHVITDDGRQVLARAAGSYDAIISDLFFPAEEATSHLYSRELFELARSRLADNGVFCLWLPCYQHSAATADLVTRTFLQVFPHAVLLRASFDPMQPVAGLLGSTRPINVSASELQHRIEAAGLTGRSPFLKSGRHAQMLLLGDLRTASPHFGSSPFITDDHPLFAFLGPAVHAREQGLYGVRFLNWAGRRFPEPRFPSCELPASEAGNLLQAIRAANHYLATAIAATVLPDDTRPASTRDQQVRQSLSHARALSPELRLDLEDLGR